eukprot:CCRYP_012220-RA/>CCRYP_012220-RA protein AED:0.20 eAED:0.26 QI:0/-1/0/1/-1/0/1/0/184
MILSAHFDATYLNARKARSRAGAHIMCSENDHDLSHNGLILTIAQIIKSVTSSTAKSELVALFICAKEMIPSASPSLRWVGSSPNLQSKVTTPQPNKTIIAKKMESMDMHLWWLRCCESQGQAHFYWGPGPSNLADYSTPQTSITKPSTPHMLGKLLLCSLQGCVEITLSSRHIMCPLAHASTH